MARYMSAEEVEREHTEKMGPELGPVYHHLHSECVWLQTKWAHYVALFGSRPERIDLLNRAAGLFFRVIQDSQWEDALLHLTRLTDPPRSAGRPNLTIQRLPPLVPEETRDEIQGLVDKAVVATAFARDWRNRHIAHRDLDLALGEGVRPLEAASRASVKNAIAAVCEVIVRTHQLLLDQDLALHLPPAEPGGAESLLYVIRDGVEADDARRARLQEGKLLPEDLKPPPAV